MTIADFAGQGCRLASIALFLMLTVAGRALGDVRSPFTATGDVNFEAIYYFAKQASNTYASEAEIMHRDPSVQWIATPGHAHVLYYVEDDPTRNAHLVAVRGTVDHTNWTFDTDTRGVTDDKARILVHEGFGTVAQVIYPDLRRHLDRGYTIHLTGHSLGGAVAALLAIYLHQDGYALGSVVTFGQPKFTNEAGAAAYGHLPLIRVVDQNDVVSMLPEATRDGRYAYVHLGAELNILSGPYYAYLSPHDAARASVRRFAREALVSSVPDHKIARYLQNLSAKLQGAERVSYEDRQRYVERHRRGPRPRTGTFRN